MNLKYQLAFLFWIFASCSRNGIKTNKAKNNTCLAKLQPTKMTFDSCAFRTGMKSNLQVNKVPA
jgi:hypothetical protein